MRNVGAYVLGMLFAITKQQTSLLEIIVAVIGVVCAPLNIFLKAALWPLNILISLLTIFLYYHRRDYSFCFASGIGILIACYGWYRWGFYRDREGKKKAVTTMRAYMWGLMGLVGAVGTCSFYVLLSKIGSKNPFSGAFSMTLCYIGLWLSSEKKLESTWCWFLYNLLAVYRNCLLGAWVFAVKYALYASLAPYQYYFWKKNQAGHQQRRGCHVRHAQQRTKGISSL